MYLSGRQGKNISFRYKRGRVYRNSKVVLSTFDANLYATKQSWRDALQISEVRCKWDLDKDN